MPNLWQASRISFKRCGWTSKATSLPVSRITCARCAVFPPGPLQASTTREPAAGRRIIDASMELSSCTTKWPAWKETSLVKAVSCETLRPSARNGLGLVTTPSCSNSRRSSSGVTFKVLQRKTTGGGSLLAWQSAIVTCRPKRFNQRSTSQAGCEYFTLICRTGSSSSDG